MNGFRNFVLMAVVCVAIGVLAVMCRVVPDIGECTWNYDQRRYDC